ncbi:MAG: 5-methyltetrahydropteroyltriglutamate--homocysteine S-methyltransferase [Bifidobacteriaceae bacterium]|nr:5-methyltetrahydropteroyltriglutamate--homocysteine S-methyltransferase [Bifidobacteriaceae bacterium]
MALTSVVGFPRIGEDRELKKLVEGYWKGSVSAEELKEQSAALRAKHWNIQKEAGIDLIPSNDFSLYDQMLDTAVLFNVVPSRYRNLGLNDTDTFFAIARGYQGEKGDVTAQPMKKWFTTNYHYLVPEITEETEIKLVGTKPFDEFEEAKAQGIITKPVLIGPYTFLKLARGAEGADLHLTDKIVDDAAAAWVNAVSKLSGAGAEWIQLDEPYLVLDKTEEDIGLLKRLYAPIVKAKNSSKILVQTYFGHIADVLEETANLGIDGIGLDLIEGRDENLAALNETKIPESVTIFAGVVNGRNIWRNNYAESLGLIDALKTVVSKVIVSAACSFLHVPFSTASETKLDANVLRHFSFAVEKLSELSQIASLAEADDSERAASDVLAANQALFDGSRAQTDETVEKRVAALKEADYTRLPVRSDRRKIQHEQLNLPVLPVTTIGSFPQTREVRVTRSQFRKGQISAEQYDAFIAKQIDDVIERQEQVGIDVLVHGEFERNDMVEYFGQNLNGFLFTSKAWVQSYGTRCVKPPIIWSDVSRARPITVKWSSYAQSRTDRIVKGMLTGPVTILNWSWPREDISRKLQTTQLALAVRDEVLDLEAAGIKVIQIDEAALREKLPVRRSDWNRKYLDWAVPAFRLVHSAVKPGTQIHTHMCYSEFNDIIRDIDQMDADVISFEASRGDLVVLDAIQKADFETEAGPGVYDIHSPRIPSEEEIEDRIKELLDKMDVSKIWINPDCGLKTRGNEETWASLENTVNATKRIRQTL